MNRLGLVVGMTAFLGACSLHEFGGETEERRTASGTVTLAFAGDIHFADPVDDLAGGTTSTLGDLSQVLAGADLAVVNLETAIASDGREPADKELEDPAARYWFRSTAGALRVLERSGVDVASMANNHGADFGAAGVEDSLRVAADTDVALVGVGADDDAAYAPFRRTVKGTDVAVHAADASFLESEDPVWSVGDGTGPGIASARGAGADRLVASVAESAERDDVVVVYLHWGEEGSADPTTDQQQLAARLAEAGADVVVGSHAHQLQGAGLLGSTYVGYGLGNFVWYHGDTAETGVLEVSVRDGEVVDDTWSPGVIPPDGGTPVALDGDAATVATTQFRALRGRTDLAEPPGESTDPRPAADLPDYEAQVSRIGSTLRDRMTSHDEATCPVPLSDLRHVRLSYVGFDGQAHTGEMVVNADVVTDVVDVFEDLYDARFPIRSMRLIDEYDGDDDRSMAANNSSGYSCRTVAGTDRWSDHAYGRAIDLNPVQNPYVVDGVANPPASQAFVDDDRSAGATADLGVIVADDVVMQAFARVGWAWGDAFGDYQHFSASGG